MPQHIQYSDAHMQISKAVQAMQRHADLEGVLQACLAEIEKMGIDIQALAVHRILNPTARMVETYRLNKMGTIDLAQRRKSTSITNTWKQNTTHYDRNIEVNHSADWVANMRTRLGGVPVVSFIDIPFSQGVISTHSIHANAFSDNDIEFLKQIAEILSLGFSRFKDLIDLERLAEELREKEQFLTAFHRIGQLTLSSLNTDQIIDNLVKHVVDNNIFRSLSVSLVNLDTNTIEIVRGRIRPDPSKEPYDEFLNTKYDINDPDVVPEVARTGRFQVIEGWDKERYINRTKYTLEEVIESYRTRVAYFMPVIFNNQVTAVLATGSHISLKDYTLQRIEAFQPLLDQLAIALEHARLYSAVQQNKQQLEQRVKERTSELQKANELLQTEMRIRQESEAQFRQAQKMEAIGHLAGGIAHDFNNLLTVINGYSSNALTDLDPKSLLYEDLKEIHEAGTRAAVLTHHLLSFSRRQTLHPEVLDLNDLVAKTQTMLRSLIPESIHLSITLKSNLNNVKADFNQLNQVIVNLAINARDAMPRGGNLSVETANVNVDTPFSERFDNIQPGPFVRISVSDTGTGIDAHTLPHIFEPFFTTKEQGDGTGLGLSMIYGLINQSNGCIDVETTVGKGTTFHIYLPQTSEPIPAIESNIDTTPEDTSAGTETILLVEDENTVRTLTKEALTRQGYRVFEAYEGKDALDLIATHSPHIDVLITDIVMPGTSGPELAQQIKKGYPNLKVIFVSGHAPAEIAKHITLEPNIPFIRKPFSPKTLTQTIRKVLNA
ncbi:MAG: signal transduction histidine kinase/CheY-like chemotaxis protein [Candidatus Latescibacterota bacterium]|jgi:signal transduction histidine kinase/CheY-like chemotaxis protein